VDACPNLNPFVKSPIVQPEKITKLINNREIKISEIRASPTSPRSVLSRSLSLDRLSRSGSQETRERPSGNRDLRTIERLSRSRTRVSDNEFNRFRESRLRTIVQSRDAKSSFDPTTRLSRSRNLHHRATDRRSAEQNFERRLANSANFENRRYTERHEFDEIARRQNHVDRSTDRRDSLNLQRRTTDYRGSKSLSTERQIVRQESREVLAGRREYRDLTRNRVPNYRSEIRERKFVERRTSIEHRDAKQLDRREDRRNLLNRSARSARGDIDRNNNMDRRNREQSLKNRHVLLDRVANQESRFAVATRGSRGNFIKSDDRRTSRLMKRDVYDPANRETLGRRVRSIESNIERSEERPSFERRSLARSMERREIDHTGRRIAENRFGDRKSVNRVSQVSSENLRQERIDRSQRTASRRDSRENAAVKENYRMTRSRYDIEGIANRERKERFARFSRSVDRREIASIRDSRDYNHRSRDSAERRDSPQERRERTSRLYQSREERRVVLQRSREEERGASERRVSERRVLERRVALDSTRLDSRSERRIDNSLKSREGSRLDRRLERNTESRVSRGRILERRSTLDSRRSLEQRIDDSSKSREEFRLADRRSERSPELRVSRGKILEKRSTLDSRILSERRIDDNSKSREGSRLADRRSERSPESRVSRGRILERRSVFDLRKSSERRDHDSFRSHEGSRMQDRRVERNSELRNSISMERRTNSRTASLENQVLRSSETQRNEIRRLTERRVARSVKNRPVEFREKESIRHLRQRSVRSIEDSSRLSSLRRVVRIPEQNREQRKLSAEKLFARTVNNEQLSAKWERNLQNARVERNMEAKEKIIPNSMKDYEFFKYPMAYELMRQAFIVALCTVYGLSLYNGKKSSFG